MKWATSLGKSGFNDMLKGFLAPFGSRNSLQKGNKSLGRAWPSPASRQGRIPRTSQSFARRGSVPPRLQNRCPTIEKWRGHAAALQANSATRFLILSGRPSQLRQSFSPPRSIAPPIWQPAPPSQTLGLVTGLHDSQHRQRASLCRSTIYWRWGRTASPKKWRVMVRIRSGARILK